MFVRTPLALNLLLSAVSICSLSSGNAYAGDSTIDPSLIGTWTLVAADVQHSDGSRAHDYGANPKGLLIIDAQGNYSLQIFKSERQPFASNDKGKVTAAEYKAAILGASTHFGTLIVDRPSQTLTFNIQSASFPNWEQTQQTRHYQLENGELSYRVTARPNGDIPISIWRRTESASQYR
ncbi:lipocalin-like domain-containing protein [Paraburkholderia sp. Ac-20347]|nr:lipocalin-like domain-containing protein [Paraburkholderia sp. Ac-20347]MBN3813397.1 lipocalin-like domain-containing protein [Paraburkholderia sp. Ac-20347]